MPILPKNFRKNSVWLLFGKLFTWELDYGVAMHLNLARGNTAFHWKKIMGPPECNRSRDWKIVHQIYLWKKGNSET